MITIWHNPRCSKSRQTLALIEKAGVAVVVRRYLDDAPSLAELKAARSALGLRPVDMIRKGEARFKDLSLDAESDEDTLMRAMASHPILIERPIVFKGDRAVVGRPPTAVNALLSN